MLLFVVSAKFYRFFAFGVTFTVLRAFSSWNYIAFFLQ